MPPLQASELTARREALGLSQAELAERFGVHTMTVSKWERGVHRIPEMVGMALTYLEESSEPPGRRRRASRPEPPAEGA
jgi:DNA-binding transcriptional regulator YiaG